MNYLLVVILWTAYCALHSFLISVRFTALMTRLLKNYYAFYRLFYVVSSVILLVPLIRFAAEFDSPVIMAYDAPLSIARYALMSVSLLLFFWAFFFDYDCLSFFGIRQILNFAKPKTDATPVKLKRNGLLGIVRHPMYGGATLFLFGTPLLLGSAFGLVFASLLVVLLAIRSILEERALADRFPDYAAYREKVRYRFVPHVW